MLVSGGSSSNLTKNYYTRNEWSDLNPVSFNSRVADNSLFMEGSVVNLRFDLDEQINAVSTYTSLDSSENYSWKSKKFNFPQKETFDYIKVDADGPVQIKVYADNLLVETLTVEDFNPTIFCHLPHAYNWEFELVGNVEVRSVDIFERNIINMGESINLTPENNQAWRLSWLKFPDSGAFAGGICTTEGDEQIQIEFYHDSLDLVHVETVFSGRVFRLPNLPTGTLWRVSVPNKDHIIRSLTLFSRRRQIFTDKVHEFRVDPSVQPWALKTYEAQKPVSFSAAQIKSSSYPIAVKFFADNQELYSVTFANDKAIRLPFSRMEKNYSFEIDESKGIVSEFAVATSMSKLKG